MDDLKISNDIYGLQALTHQRKRVKTFSKRYDYFIGKNLLELNIDRYYLKGYCHKSSISNLIKQIPYINKSDKEYLNNNF